MEFVGHFRRLTPVQRNTFVACFLGWSLDAFDFFILTFCVSAIATQFQAKISAVVAAVSLTLAMRPVGAFLFGLMADRFGRRPALMVDIIAYSVFELASAFAPSLKTLLIMRALFGIAMGGEWGVGAALAFETLPVEGRGFFSGLLQEGYAVGYLIAALVYGTVFRYVGWRGMFVIGALPAFLVIYIRTKVHESPAWTQGKVSMHGERHISKDILAYVGTFIFLVLLMFSFNSFSHGTQDLYPTFLQKDHKFTPQTVGLIAVVANIGALLGGIVFGTWSEKIGRRRAIVLAALLAIPVIPLWAYSHTVPMLALGGFLMQFMVQGAWGVIPAHLNELSPPAVRGTFPGFAYQLGNFLSSWNIRVQARLVEQRYAGLYAPVLVWTVAIIATLVAVVTWSGRERRGADLSKTS
ncbi:Major facilitator superfamily MFS_1 [Candidatus Sulfotelmatobacter kueseliae]|uniref:Major facilitator superfamily MFS_1 n=1 Tax=Candidatus Sulfotelmatobacter kueseliae TaxID=2042962 RepID=A0A2U3JV94_9BACT|nr:Major facilitator superfamily MFS_1 [Candidatus Sulfotelmatobacter kueseliae]